MSAKKAVERRARGEQAGDCVDCNQCVAVCPIGIDIRQGPNIACINCGLCVDACDGVMAKLGRSRGLIDYESWANIERGRKGEPLRKWTLRPKAISLAAFCVVLAGGMSYVFATRSTTSLSVEHDRNPRFVLLSDGGCATPTTFKIVNHGGTARTFGLRVEGIGDSRLGILGASAEGTITVAPDDSQKIHVTLTSAASDDARIRFVASDDVGRAVSAAEHFFVH